MTPLFVLVVDDDEAHRRLVTEILGQEPFVVTQAATADEALFLVERDRPDVAIVDMILPRSGGKSLARRIKARHPEIAILAISGSPSALPTLSDGDFAAALAKPFHGDELIDLVRGLGPRSWPIAPEPPAPAETSAALAFGPNRGPARLSAG